MLALENAENAAKKIRELAKPGKQKGVIEAILLQIAATSPRYAAQILLRLPQQEAGNNEPFLPSFTLEQMAKEDPSTTALVVQEMAEEDANEAVKTLTALCKRQDNASVLAILLLELARLCMAAAARLILRLPPKCRTELAEIFLEANAVDGEQTKVLLAAMLRKNLHETTGVMREMTRPSSMMQTTEMLLGIIELLLSAGREEG